MRKYLQHIIKKLNENGRDEADCIFSKYSKVETKYITPYFLGKDIEKCKECKKGDECEDYFTIRW